MDADILGIGSEGKITSKNISGKIVYFFKHEYSRITDTVPIIHIYKAESHY